MTHEEVNTKLIAYKLIHDPIKLLSLLYSKYNDIEEDYYLLISNQIIFNRPTHLNIYYKEYFTFYDETEFMRRYYKKKECTSRILKLSEYYCNYQSFFCKATLTDFILGNILKNYQDIKAEIFYRNNYKDNSMNKEEKDINCINTQSLSSLDNITYNQTIFDKKYKQIIENEEKNASITLTLDSLRKKEKKNEEEKNLISTNEKDSSFIECLKNIVYFKEKKKELKKKKNDKKSENNNYLKNLSKNAKEKFKKKIDHNMKIILEKSNKDSNGSKNLFSILNLNSPLSADMNYFSKRNKKFSEKNNLFLSPQKNNKFNITNITSHFSQFKKQVPLDLKYLNRNKSYHNNNNKIISRIISKNFNPILKNRNYFNKENEINLNKGRSVNMSKLKRNSKKKDEIKNKKLNHPKITRYNLFLLLNKTNLRNINSKNNTYDILNNGNKIKNITNQSNNIFNHYKKLVLSPKQNQKEIINHRFGSNYNLFKTSILSNENNNNMNKQNKKKKFNKRFFAASNSLENNIHISSFSPKSFWSNLNINNNCIQNNINITNKIKIQSKHNKSNSNYNINFNNLFFYGANTPSNYIDYIGNNIKNNQNINLKNVNTNFYMLNFNNFANNSIDYNSRNKNIFNNSKNQKEIKIKNNSNYNNNIYKSFNNKGINLNQNKIPIFTLYKNNNNKIKDISRGKTKEKIKNIKMEINNKYKRNF